MILDYLRKSTNGEIVIPNFHTGHLGFVPDTEVSVSLHELFLQSTKKRHCELLVTPFDPNFSTLCYLTCVMKDQPGVVNKLIDAISSLKINIVKQESSSINTLNHHVIELVLDWKTSQYGSSTEATPKELMKDFKHLSHLLPINIYKYFVLFKTIMSRCGSIITFDQSYGECLPSIKIIPFSETTHTYDVRRVQIKNKEINKKVNAFIELDPRHLARIKLMCDSRNGAPLHYIISSEANTRSLRIFFLNSNSIDKIFYVSFTHNDVPGALSAITSALVEADFNILTGLLRKKDNIQSGYETILEYQGDKTLPFLPNNKKSRVDWVYDRILECSDQKINLLADFDVEVGSPLYPKTDNYAIKISRKNSDILTGISSYTTESEYFDSMIEGIRRSKDQEYSYKKERLILLQSLQKITNKKPIIYLSYPDYAKGHAQLLIEAIDKEFDKEFELRQYQETIFENTLNMSIGEIRSCDYFIGIWHHEFNKGKDEYSVSPWLPFEYGIARILEKGIVVMHSDKLPENVWKRIDTSLPHLSYNNLNFKDVIQQKVLPVLRDQWYREAYL